MVATARKSKPLTAGLAQIEELTEVFSVQRQDLVDAVNALEKDLRAAKMRHLAKIKAAAARVKDAQAELSAAIEANRGEFEKPKTRTFFGIKVGFRKLIGTLSWTDPQQVVKLVKRHFPAQVDVLIRTTEVPVKDALAQLPAADLKRLGVSVGEDTDEVVIRATDSDVEKFVDALLKEAADTK